MPLTKDHYNEIIKLLNNMVWSTGTDGKINFVNRAWLEYTGKTLEEEKGDGWFSGIHPADREYCRRTYLKAFTKRLPFEIKYHLKRFNGDYGLISNQGKPVFNEDGEFTGYVGVCIDLEAYILNDCYEEVNEPVNQGAKHYGNEYNQLSQQLGIVFESIVEGIVVTDREGRIILLNKSARDMIGCDDGAIGERLEDIFKIVNEETRKPVVNPVKKVLETGKIQGLANHTVLIAKDGQERAIADSASPIVCSAGTIQGVVMVFRDVTRERELILQLEEHHLEQ